MSRIIYLTVRTPLGSGEEFIIPEMMELLRRNHSLLIVPRSPGSQVVQDEALALQSCCVYQPLLSWVILRTCICEFLQNSFRCLGILLQILFQSRNFLHLVKNLIIFPKALWLAHLAKKWKAEHLHAHWALSTATMAMIAGEITGIPWSFTAHSWDITENNMLEAKVRSAAFVRFISHIGFLAQASIKRKLQAKCQVIPMGVVIPRNIVSVNRREFRKQFTIMCPASLDPVKGHFYLLQAIAKLKDRGVFCKLLLAGQGPLLSNLQRQIAEFEIQDRVKFLGQLPHVKLLQYYDKNRVDLVVLPSIDLGRGFHEGIPVSLMEAMAFGIPVIATATGGIPELIGKEAGILVPPKDSNTLADAIEKLIGDAHLWARLAINGHQRIRNGFDVNNVVDILYSLIKHHTDRTYHD